MVRVPKPGELGIAMVATTRVEARVQAPAQTVVAIEHAPVVEFFGVPLEGAQDVVFVLDCSGSMSGTAQGRLATYTVAPPSDVPPGPPGPPPPSDFDPTSTPSSPSDPSAPPYDPSQPTAPYPADPNAPPAGTDPSLPASSTPSTGPLRKIDIAQAELADALSRLPAGTRMNVVFFNDGVDAYAPTLVPLDEPVRPDLVKFAHEATPVGSTALAPAMRIAFLMNAKRIVLLSDGLGNVGGNSASIIRDAREAMRGGVRIDTVGVGRDQDGSLLETLARESGGLYQAL